MNITITVIVFLSIASFAAGWAYSYLAWVPFFTLVGTRKNFARIPKKSLWRFAIPGFLVLVFIALIFFTLKEGRESLFLLMPISGIVGISIAMTFFFIRWKQAPNPLDITLKQHFKNIWPDVIPVALSDLSLKKLPKVANIENWIRKNEYRITEFWFIKKEIEIESVLVMYLSYLDGLGHESLPCDEADLMDTDHRKSFVTTDGEYNYIHSVTTGEGDLYHVYSEVVD